MTGPVRVGIAQINPTVGDFEANSRKIIDRIEEAEQRGLEWVIFSELALCGYPVWDLATRQGFVETGLAHLARIAASTGGKKILAVLGFIDRGPRDSNKNYNALAVLSQGRIIHKQYKTLLPTYDVFLEQIFFKPASEQKIFKYEGLPVGFSICEDIWEEQYSIKPAQILARKGARLIVNISASPYHKHVAEIRDSLIQRRAKETHAYLVYVNQVGGQDDLIFDGRSLVATPEGEIIFRGETFKEGLYEVPLDFRAKTALRPVPLEVDYSREMYQALVTGLGDYVRKNGFRRVVMGLSGGIDSALTAAIARDALGPEAVIGVAMPGEYSDSSSLADAEKLARNLKIEFRTRPIADTYRAFLAKTIECKKKEGAAPYERERISLAMENLQARLRGLELMYVSNDEGAMLLSTGNKSELAQGYCTLYGDMSGGLCVLGDVYKTEVYRLAAYRNRLSPVIPEESIRKAPTAELRPNQKDQDSLPPYEMLDDILLLYIEKNMSREEITRGLAGRIAEEVVRAAIDRVDHNEYKRKQSPPILRVTEKAWFGRRMPITNHFHG